MPFGYSPSTWLFRASNYASILIAESGKPFSFFQSRGKSTSLSTQPFPQRDFPHHPTLLQPPRGCLALDFSVYTVSVTSLRIRMVVIIFAWNIDRVMNLRQRLIDSCYSFYFLVFVIFFCYGFFPRGFNAGSCFWLFFVFLLRLFPNGF